MSEEEEDPGRQDEEGKKHFLLSCFVPPSLTPSVRPGPITGFSPVLATRAFR